MPHLRDSLVGIKRGWTNLIILWTMATSLLAASANIPQLGGHKKRDVMYNSQYATRNIWLAEKNHSITLWIKISSISRFIIVAMTSIFIESLIHRLKITVILSFSKRTKWRWFSMEELWVDKHVIAESPEFWRLCQLLIPRYHFFISPQIVKRRTGLSFGKLSPGGRL